MQVVGANNVSWSTGNSPQNQLATRPTRHKFNQLTTQLEATRHIRNVNSPVGLTPAGLKAYETG